MTYRSVFRQIAVDLQRRLCYNGVQNDSEQKNGYGVMKMAGFIDAFKKSFTGGDESDRYAKGLQKRLIKEINQMAENDDYIPGSSSMDMKYNFRLQKNRESAHDISVRTRCITDEKSFTGVSVLMGNDRRYVTRIPVTTCRFDKEYVSDGRTVKRDRYEGTISSYVVFAQGQDPNASYCCPNCGDINTVSQLLEQGCRSCRTRFMLPDLYPRITNYYTLRSKPYVCLSPLPFVLLGILSALLFFFFYSSRQLEMGFEYVFSMVVTGVCGIIPGYLLYVLAVLLLFSLDAVGSNPRLSAFNRTRKKLPLFMQQYDPLFSVDFFVGKVNNLLKTLIFTDDYKNCAVYEQNGENPYKDIIDVEYQGSVGLNDAACDGHYVYLDMDVYTRTTYVKKRRVTQKDDVFRMKLCRSVYVHDDCNASVHNIECRSCGASFNAVREKNCPYCRSPYNLRDYDWVVTEFERK